MLCAGFIKTFHTPRRRHSAGRSGRAIQCAQNHPRAQSHNVHMCTCVRCAHLYTYKRDRSERPDLASNRSHLSATRARLRARARRVIKHVPQPSSRSCTAATVAANPRARGLSSEIIASFAGARARLARMCAAALGVASRSVHTCAAAACCGRGWRFQP